MLRTSSIKVRKYRGDYLYIHTVLLCFYNYATSGNEKSTFYKCLQQTFSEVAYTERFVILGDFDVPIYEIQSNEGDMVA